jgi:hypothetical protein
VLTRRRNIRRHLGRGARLYPGHQHRPGRAGQQGGRDGRDFAGPLSRGVDHLRQPLPARPVQVDGGETKRQSRGKCLIGPVFFRLALTRLALTRLALTWLALTWLALI